MRLSLWVILFLVAVSVGSRADTTGVAVDSSVPHTENLISLDYARTLAFDVKLVFMSPLHWREPQWERLAVYSSAAIGAVAVSDLEMRLFVQRNRSRFGDDFFDEIEPFGRHYPFIISGSFYLTGVIFKKPNARATGLDGFAASLIASEMITPALKEIIGRKRPFRNEGEFKFDSFSSHDAFPSGHTTRAFAVATVIASHYKQKWVKVAAYSIATLVAYSRMNSDMHWSSDVLAGGIIGFTVGKAVVKLNQSRRGK